MKNIHFSAVVCLVALLGCSGGPPPSATEEGEPPELDMTRAARERGDRVVEMYTTDIEKAKQAAEAMNQAIEDHQKMLRDLQEQSQ